MDLIKRATKANIESKSLCDETSSMASTRSITFGDVNPTRQIISHRGYQKPCEIGVVSISFFMEAASNPKSSPVDWTGGMQQQ